ncbi:MAG: SMP-30/gluconolactonase/LRE family protein [Planctomycetaceae bacterium]|nr:SMP-30/gluconolactonase/LRE family protein [Planctomycetaceae bacterium]
MMAFGSQRGLATFRQMQGAALLAIFAWAAGADAAPPQGDPRIIPEGARVEELWNEGEFTEGVAVAPDGAIYFSDIPAETAGRILKFDPRTGRTTVYSADSGKSNGLMFDRAGRLIAVCGANEGRQALCEITPGGQLTVLVDKFEGKVFNAPNDLVIHPSGSIYFTDPRYVGKEPLELDHQSVYRFDPATTQVSRVTTDNPKPNGIVCSPDGKTLYIALNDNGREQLGMGGQLVRPVQTKLLAYPVRPDGTLGPSRTLIDYQGKYGIDGMTVDQRGNIYAAVRDAGRPGIAVYSPDGQEIAHIPTADLPTNCCFGVGEEASTLYITAGRGLFRIPLKIPGYHPATAATP